MKWVRLFVFFGLGFPQLPAEYRTYTNHSGHSVEARLIELKDGGSIVRIGLRDGRELDAKLSAFNQDDQKHIRKWWESELPSRPLPHDPVRIQTCPICGASGISMPCAETPTIPIYEPDSVTKVEIQRMKPPAQPEWGYNHDADLVHFKRRFIAMWNGNEISNLENKPEQYNYVRYSDDFLNWSPPKRPFGAAAGAIHPVEMDNQFQPSFINFNDEKLFVGWNADMHFFISESEDGDTWTNVEQPPNPGDGVNVGAGFPSVQGLLTEGGRMLMPLSMRRDLRHAYAYYSDDGGMTWAFSEPIVSQELTEMGLDPADFGDEPRHLLWEPVFFEHADGRIGCVVRNMMRRSGEFVESDGWRKPLYFPYRATDSMLYSESKDGGQTWTEARPLELETTSSRPWVLRPDDGGDGLYAVFNDWPALNPAYIMDRNFLALYAAPVDDPDLLLPGPLVQPRGALGHYPSGFVEDGSMFVTYSLGGNARSIWATRLAGLPTFEEPFFMVREGWGPEVEIKCNTASFRDNSSSLPLVLTRKLTEKARLKLSFEAKAQMMTAFAPDAVILTVGGKTRNGMHIAANKNLRWQVTIGEETSNLGAVRMGETQRFEVVMDAEGFSIGIDGAEPKRFDTKVLRKICFGGLYQHPLGYPSNTWVDLDLASVELR